MPPLAHSCLPTREPIPSLPSRSSLGLGQAEDERHKSRRLCGHSWNQILRDSGLFSPAVRLRLDEIPI